MASQYLCLLDNDMVLVDKEFERKYTEELILTKENLLKDVNEVLNDLKK